MKYSITIGLEPLDGIHDHPTRMVSTFDLERNSFPVTVESCQGAEGREDDTLFLSMTPSLRQIMLMLMMTYAYLDNNNNGDLHRELLLPCLLCVMKNCMRKMNSLKLDVLNEDYEENMKEIQRMHPRAIRPPLIACDYRTSVGQRKREKGDRMKISFLSQKQTIKTFVANLRCCKGCIRKGQSYFKDVCDEVVENLRSRGLTFSCLVCQSKWDEWRPCPLHRVSHRFQGMSAQSGSVS